MLQRQKDAEKKANMELEDAKLAQQLQDEWEGVSRPSTISQPSSQNGPSAFDRMLGRRPPQSQPAFGQLSFPQPILGPSSPYQSVDQPYFGSSSRNRNDSQSQVNGGDTFDSDMLISSGSTFNQGSSTKNEPNFLQRQSSNRGSNHSNPGGSVKKEYSTMPLNMPGAFPLESTVDSDSDIEIIPASAFHDNGRHQLIGNQASASFPVPYGSPYASGISRSPAAESARQAALNRTNGLYSQQGAAVYRPSNSVGLNGYGRTLPAMNGMGANSLPGGILSYNPYVQPPGTPGASVYQTGRSPLGSNPFSTVDPIADMMRNTSNTDWTAQLNDPNRAMEISDLMNDPRKTAAEIQELLSNIRPDEEIPKENREGTPDGLKYPLYEHQKLSLAWLKKMEEGTNKGGILADDMGLGKTISIISLILSRPSSDRARKVKFEKSF
jgi:hypothetical protein